MVSILQTIGMWTGTAILLGIYIALLIIMLITVFYGIGYLYDSVFGNSIYKMGVNITKKYPKIRNIKILVKVKKLIEPRKHYTRYETPLCTYCFSYTALLLIYILLNVAGIEKGGWIIAFMIYILLYFTGMYRRYKGSGCYNHVLDNNFEFLKLSFVPLTFLITVVGFAFTIAGLNIQQINLEYFSPIILSVQENGFFAGITFELWLVVKCSIIVVALMYIVSIPMQLVSYYIILIIRYFQKYGNGYKKIVSFYLEVCKSIVKK